MYAEPSHPHQLRAALSTRSRFSVRERMAKKEIKRARRLARDWLEAKRTDKMWALSWIRCRSH